MKEGYRRRKKVWSEGNKHKYESKGKEERERIMMKSERKKE
jgi:hypothetical protein